MQSKLFFILVLILSFAFSNVWGQTPKPKSINGGIINGKAVTLPKPEYPAAAQAVKASGAVNVQVTIDENGSVISATAVSGHPLLRQAAEQAALQSTFKPTLLSGQPVRVTGVIVYNFVPSVNNEEKVKPLGLGAVLSILHKSAANLEQLNEVFGSAGLLDGISDEFPKFSKELAPLASLEKASGEKRLEIIEGVISSIQPKLEGSDVWQFELGKSFGEFMAPFFQATAKSKGEFDLSKLNESELRSSLITIKELMKAVPSNFPADISEKFKQFAEFDSQKKILTPENLQEIWANVMEILETISPDSTK